ncbi:NAD-dependent epimerase/dehydratase family protein [Saccharothrix australiensis]|uniref:Nucleoside-diphosphate-sugar epimerase n=1 Tax=Saccharothrix australiensis TaxID=2072 RepID=A0A495W3N6_9PSEU|nr:NAD(P)-dependent oxidoreductase [Saccharothrix australiensis]RKT55710.1 nucleoside-diphosphate-sugar epimerase [Saccharothrix australiensis]
MRVFAIGATGVLGRELVPRLVARGHQVAVMSPGGRQAALPPGVDRVRGSLLDPDAGELLAARVRGFDVVVNTATAIPRDFAAKDAWAENSRVRVEGTRVVAGAVSAAGVPALVQLSVTMAYPDGGERLLRETEPLDACAARAAIAAPVADLEATVRALPVERVAWTVLRAARFVGPGTVQDRQRADLRAGTVRVAGNGREFVSMVHVADFADAVVAAVERPARGLVLNVSDEPVRNGAYLARLAALDGVPGPVLSPGLRADAVSHRVCSAAARQALGWRPVRGIWPSDGAAARGIFCSGR